VKPWMWWALGGVGVLGGLGALHYYGVVAYEQPYPTAEALVRGARTLEHEADVIIDVQPGGRWTVRKSRFSLTGVVGEVQLCQ